MRVQILPHGRGLELPSYATQGSSGMDLRAAIPDGEVWHLGVGERRLIPTGLAMAIPLGFEGQVRSRSGLAIKKGVTVLNSPGTIDADYRGEVSVILINHGHEEFEIQRGDRIAQLVIAALPYCGVFATWEEVDDLGPTDRGIGGFGHTGIK